MVKLIQYQRLAEQMWWKVISNKYEGIEEVSESIVKMITNRDQAELIKGGKVEVGQGGNVRKIGT